MDTIYKVFVSSTVTDLKREREQVMKAIMESGCLPVGMEFFPATNKKKWDAIKAAVDGCEFFLLIVGGRYGNMCEDEAGNRVSFVEREYDYACSCGKDIIILLNEDPEALPQNKCERTDEGRKKLEAFIEKLEKSDRIVDHYSNADEIMGKVARSIDATRICTKQTGYTKGLNISEQKLTALQNKYENVKRALTNQRNENKKLKEELKNEQMEAREEEKAWIKKISELKEALDGADSEIEELRSENERLRTESRKQFEKYSEKLDFTYVLAYANATCTYFGKARDNLIEDIRNIYGRELTCEEINFLKYYPDPKFWEETTGAALALHKNFLNMSALGRENFLEGTKTGIRDFITDNDYLGCGAGEVKALFAYCFAFILLSETRDVGDFKITVDSKKKELMSACNYFVSELWEIECALSENDN